MDLVPLIVDFLSLVSASWNGGLSNEVESFLLQNGSDHVSCFEALVGVRLYHEVALAAAFGRVPGFDDYAYFFADELLAELLL